MDFLDEKFENTLYHIISITTIVPVMEAKQDLEAPAQQDKFQERLDVLWQSSKTRLTMINLKNIHHVWDEI